MPSLKRRINGNLHEAVSQKGEGNQLGDRENALDRGGTDDNQFYNHQAMAVPQHESLSIKYAMTTSESELQRTSNHVSDVVGVILSTTVRHQNVSSNMSSTKNTRLRILITDDSIPNGQCARVNIPSSCTTISELNLQAGDIVRFNGMEARKGDIELETLISSPLTKKQRNDTCKRTNDDEADVIHQNLLFNVVCELYPSWKEPISEPRIAILCRIGSQMPSYNPQLSFNWTNVAKRMNTPDDLIENLSKWFCSQKQHSRLVSSNPQPCQRRKLRDITSSNITSHVVVKVLRCEKTSQQWNVSKNLVAEPYITHATLSDGVECDDIMGLGGSLQVKQSGRDFCFIPKPISEILLQSLTGGCRILLTNVLSQSTSRDSLTITGRETQMLLPTRDTIATVITPDHPFYVKDSPQKENQFASQPMTLEKSSRLYSLSQQHSPAQASADSLEKGCRGVMAIISPGESYLVHIDRSCSCPHHISAINLQCETL